jgi:Putative zinc-finger
MDHSQAVRLNMTEKYILGELSGDAREQFEEHYFDCPECSSDVRALSTFVTAARMVSEEQAAKGTALGKNTKIGGWFHWLRPAIAVPAIAALAAVVMFQNAVTIPELKKNTVRPGVQIFESSHHLQGSTRGENGSLVTAHENESIALHFDFTPAESFPRYEGRLVDAAGHGILNFDIKGEQANKELHLVIPPGKVDSGSYSLVFTGDNGTNSTDPKTTEVQRLSFVVQAQP